MYSVRVLRNYVNSEDIRYYLEKNGFETSIHNKYTGCYVDEDKNQNAIQTFADKYLIEFTFNGDRFPPQRVFKRIFAETDEVLEFEATFGEEPSFSD